MVALTAATLGAATLDNAAADRPAGWASSSSSSSGSDSEVEAAGNAELDPEDNPGRCCAICGEWSSQAILEF